MSVLNSETNLVTKCKSNPKMLYSYINNQKTCKEYIRTLTKKNGEITTDENEIVQILNNQFCEVFNSATNFIEAVTPDQTVKFPSKTDKSIFTTSNVLSTINKLDTHKSASPDGLHPLVIKSCSQSFAMALSLIFQASFETGIVPEMWKLANITPIFKKGQRSDPE